MGMIWLVASLHVVWGSVLIWSNMRIQTASMISLNYLFGWSPYLLGTILIAVGLGTIIPRSISKLRKSTLAIVTTCIQQIFVMMCARDSGSCAWYGVYADNTVVSSLHILYDQLPYLAIAVMHTLDVASDYKLIRGLRAWTYRR